jgi:hypothetical protein
MCPSHRTAARRKVNDRVPAGTNNLDTGIADFTDLMLHFFLFQ